MRVSYFFISKGYESMVSSNGEVDHEGKYRLYSGVVDCMVEDSREGVFGMIAHPANEKTFFVFCRCSGSFNRRNFKHIDGEVSDYNVTRAMRTIHVPEYIPVPNFLKDKRCVLLE